MAFLEFAHIHKEFAGSVAVQEFNLEVDQGEFISLLGPSGCGKTTMLRIVAGFEKPSTGQIIVQGQDLTNTPPNKRKMGMVFQSYALFPHMTAADNVGYGLRVAGRPKAEIEQRVREMLDLVQLGQFGPRYPYQLSGGQQQRVALARALAIQPALLLLDEPLSALDAKVRAEVREEIRRIQTQLGITTIFVTHDQEEAMSISDRVVVMSRGQIEQVGKPFTIYNYPKTAFVASFVGTLNQLPCVVSDAAAGQVIYNDKMMTTPGPIDQPAGSAVVLMLRPEELRLGGGGQNQIDALVKSVSFQGSVVRVRLKPTASVNGNTSLTVDLFNERSLQLPEVGQTHTISFPPQACWVMPAPAPAQ
jgi:putative spermidine/putrescine transport system ATP-binding protein